MSLLDTEPKDVAALPAVPVTLRTKRRQLLSRLLKSKAATISVIILLIVVVAAIAAPWLSPHDPFANKLIQRLKPPMFSNSSGIYLLGTDSLGRDILSRIIYGARVSLTVGVSAVAISGVIGVLIGLLSGYFGGKVDDVFMRICDVQLSFPTILLALTIMAVLGSGR